MRPAAIRLTASLRRRCPDNGSRQMPRNRTLGRQSSISPACSPATSATTSTRVQSNLYQLGVPWTPPARDLTMGVGGGSWEQRASEHFRVLRPRRPMRAGCPRRDNRQKRNFWIGSDIGIVRTLSVFMTPPQPVHPMAPAVADEATQRLYS